MLHDARGGPALYVSVFFRRLPAFDKTAVDLVAHGIADAVSRVATSAAATKIELDIPWHALPHEIAHISVRRSINGVDKLWHADAGGWVAEILPVHVREVLSTKGRMHFPARQRCDELWLVIVNDLFSRAAKAELPPETADTPFDHPFDRLLWLIPHIPKVIPLRSSSAA
jgi:hypothetical protein